MLATTVPAAAVLDGTTDSEGRFDNVGVLQLRFDGQWSGFCSGVLVAPDLVLTAAHCTDFFTQVAGDPEQLGPDDWRVSFDAAPDEGSTYYYAARFEVHPDWLASTSGPARGNSKQSFLKEGQEDVALVHLAESVDGVVPAPVADTGYWDGLDPADETFTFVGYGIDGFVTGSAFSSRAIVVDDGARSYRDVSLVTTQDLFPDRFFKITASICFGDSGGPLFHEGTVVALNSWTSSLRCAGPALDYRVDSEQAQSFLAGRL